MHEKLLAAGVASTYTLVLQAGHGWQDTAPKMPGFPGPISPTAREINAHQVAVFVEQLR
jgi:hypothetical protein